MNKDFIVGVDFGHGETAAYVIPLSDNEFVKREGVELNIRLGNKAEDRVLPSIVYCSQSNEYSLSDGRGKTLFTAFKGRLSELSPEKKNAYNAFIKCVFESILANNKYLKCDSNGANFYFCIACPTRWNNKEKEDYIAFFNSALAVYGVSVLFVMNESDAAYFSHIDLGSLDSGEPTLVIDYGSSTIDYTLMHNHKKISEDDWSNQKLGANLIEKTLLLRYKDRQFLDYNKTLQETLAGLQASGNEHICDNIDYRLEYALREAKQFSYSKGDSDIGVSYSFYKVSGYEPLKNIKFYIDCYNFEDDILDYRQAVKSDFIKLSENIANKLSTPLSKIVLSGGASIMPWVREYVSEIFPSATIIQDSHPSFVVAKGIARYAHSRLEAENTLHKKVNTIDLEELYRTADSEATRDAIVKLIPDTLKQISSGSDKSGNEIYNILWKFLWGLNGSNDVYCSLLKDAMNAKIQKVIRSHVRESIKSVFGADIDVSDIKVNLDYRIFSYPHEFYDPDSPGGAKIVSILEDATGPHIFTGFDPDKLRDASVRRIIADKCLHEFSQLNPFGAIRYKEEDFKEFKDELLPIIHSQVQTILHVKELFATTFCA